MASDRRIANVSIDMPEYEFKDSEFEDIELINADGFSDIFKAFHPSFGYVAVKKNRRSSRQDEKQELVNLLLKHTRHPNIVPTFGVIASRGMYDGQVMEFMELGNLHTVTRNPKIEYSMKRVYSWSMKTALALAYLHKAQIIHRDIKTMNMLLGKSLDDLKISGFDVAIPINNSDETMTMGIGTMMYMAPEIIDSNEYSFPIDIYSLSISIWELIHRKAPYEGVRANPYRFLNKILNENMRPKIKKSSSLNSLLIRGWDRDINLRPTISEFLKFTTEAYKTADDSDIIRLEDSAANRNVWQAGFAQKLIGFDIPEHDESEFTISGLIGYGGLANVHEAYHNKYGDVALKINKKTFGNIEQDLQEVRILIKHSRHPNIVQVFGLLVNAIGDNKRYAGYIMEFMKLGSLFNVIHNPEKKYNMKKVLIWIEKASLGLEYLHDSGVLHRDVKPANFLLGNSLDNLKISDFGMAKASTLDITHGDGTFFYLAPEVMNENNYSNHSDVYALAISIWEMATRRKPYDHLGDKKKSLFSMGKYIVEEQERPETVDDSPLNSILKRGWNEDPNLRPSLTEFINFAKKESLSADYTNISKNL